MGDPMRLAITIDGSQCDKSDQCPGPCKQQNTLTLCSQNLGSKPGADTVSKGDHTDPRQYRIRGAQTQAVGEVDPAAIMQNRPRYMHGRACREVHIIQQVVPGHDHQAQAAQNGPG
ncbi:hypothetical protein D3C87_1409910 [compost metagenome]